MLYKYLFYGYSYYVKKFDWFGAAGETYYVGGALTVGLTIDILLFNIHSIMGILWFPEFLDYKFTFWGKYWTLIIPLALTIYLGVTGKNIQVYDEVAHFPRKKATLAPLHPDGTSRSMLPPDRTGASTSDRDL